MAFEPANPSVTPTKTHRDENFPVASRLIAPRLRPAVLAFYRFVRAADDIADSPDLAPDEKLRRLDALEAALERFQAKGLVPLCEALRRPETRQTKESRAISDSMESEMALAPETAERLAADLAAADARFGAGADEARRLLSAFRQDATKRRYADWAELLAYCERSADPVGRFLLRLHGEDEAAAAPADALCTALQILNHLQDLVPDRERLDRIYLPVPWMEQAGGEARFFAPEPSRARRAVLDAALDRVDALVMAADALPARVRDRRLAAESAVTVALARRLAAKLRAADPVLERVALGPADFARGFAAGLARAVPAPRLRDAALVRRAVARSGSSFRLGMSSLSGERRRAIHAVYAFCRAIDDIADGAAPAAERQRFLDEWRREIEGLSRAPATPIGRELARAVARFDLPVREFHALLDGMETDAAARVRLADDAALDLYCRQVAGAVGVLSVHIFGVPEAEDFALGLGRTLQLVNVLRDIDEDAARDRVYVPLARLAPGVAERPAPDIVRDPAFTAACAALAEAAAQGFAAADRVLTRLDRQKLRPAMLMMEAYRTVFERLRTRGWQGERGRPRLTRVDKLRLLWLALGPGRHAARVGLTASGKAP